MINKCKRLEDIQQKSSADHPRYIENFRNEFNELPLQLDENPESAADRDLEIEELKRQKAQQQSELNRLMKENKALKQQIESLKIELSVA